VSDPQEKEAARGGALDAEQVAPFQFPLTWSSLVDADVFASGNNLPVPVKSPRSGFDPGARWSMVVPRMDQPAPAMALPAGGVIEAARFAAPRYVAPRFEVSLDSASLAVKMLLSAAVAMLLIPGWRDTGSAGARAVQLESTMSAANWVRELTRDGTVALYRASVDKTDYRLQFNWNVNSRGIAWLFRFQDASNYYGVRIKGAGSAPSRTLSIEHFAEINGAARSRTVKLATLASRDTTVPIRMEASSSQFRIYVNSAPISQWTDTRLAAGGVGFIDNGAVHKDVQSVRISFP